MQDERSEDSAPLREPHVRHEPNMISFRGLWWTAAGLATLISGGFLLMEGLTSLFGPPDAGDRPGGEERQTPPLVDAADLDVDQAAALAALRKREKERLNEYAWVDEPNRIARIPIKRALDLLSNPSDVPEARSDSQQSGGQHEE
jgi:hypothetical protein